LISRFLRLAGLLAWFGFSAAVGLLRVCAYLPAAKVTKVCCPGVYLDGLLSLLDLFLVLVTSLRRAGVRLLSASSSSADLASKLGTRWTVSVLNIRNNSNRKVHSSN